MSRAWLAQPSGVLLWEEFDGQFVVFNVASGRTHLLNEAAAAVLRAIAELPSGSTSGYSVDQIMRRSFATDDPGWAQHVTRILHEFESEGLVCLSQT